MTDFNFLRIKWPKLAAIAADAGRLVEVSPASAISTMQTFCEWAADIVLDLYEISAQNGSTQQEKLDTLKATGHVPADVVERFRSIMMAGGRRLYRDNEDVEEARACIEDVYEIGRWLNKEADRAGWPPKNDFYRPVISPLSGGESAGAYSAGKIGQSFANFKPLIVFGLVAVLVIAGAVWGISALTASTSGKAPPPVLTPTPTVSLTPTTMLITMQGGGPTATPAPEAVVFLDSLRPSSTRETFFLKNWKFRSGDKPFTIGDKQYRNGIGMYIPKASITQTQGTWSMKFKLNGDYSKVYFDLGADANIGYGQGYGQFRIQIYCDSDHNDPVYDTGGLKEYDFTDMGQTVNITGCQTLIIKLTEKKGTKGTINVVLGDIRLVKAGTGDASASAGDTATATDGASSAPESTGTEGPTASINPDGEGDQQLATTP